MAALKAAQDATTKLADEQKKLQDMIDKNPKDPNIPVQQKAVDAASKDLNDKTQALSDPVSQAEQKLADARKTNPPGSKAVTDAQAAKSPSRDSMRWKTPTSLIFFVFPPI